MEEYDTYTTQEDCEANGSAEGAGDGVWEEAGSDCTNFGLQLQVVKFNINLNYNKAPFILGLFLY